MALTPLFGSIVPTAKPQALQSNYIDFTSGAGNDFSQQYLPEIYEAEVERYGNRTLSGFLNMVGAEMPMTSDQVVWSEQNRLHVSYDACTLAGVSDATLTIQDADGKVGAGAGQHAHAIRENQTIVVFDPATGTEQKAIVSGAPDATSVEAYPFDANAWDTTLVGAAALKVFVFGSEFGKGTNGMTGAVDASFTQFSNSPIIIKDKYEVSGSDASQIGWVEVATEDGTGGYLWYLKAESETRLRFEDYLEMSVVEGTKAAAGSGVANIAGNVKYKGTEGLFAAIKSRGNTFSAFAPAAGVLTDFDAILKNLDTQGAIEENMLFVNRQLSLTIDNMLGGVSSGTNGGVAYGLFENSEDMALNLGFSGFRRGSYDFYKTDWKYLNDASTRGAVADAGIEGVLVPAGTSTVYDQILGTNIRRPFLHVRYRASQTDDRRMKSWLTGSVGGAYTSDLDAMEVHFLSERCLCVQGANNFVIFTD